MNQRWVMLYDCDRHIAYRQGDCPLGGWVRACLEEGDELQQGDIVITASGSSVEIQSVGDASFSIPENNEFLINDELFGVGVAGSEAEVMDATVATLLEAVEAGSDLLEGLEAPGAGGNCQ
jgi:hypothetical protein